MNRSRGRSISTDMRSFTVLLLVLTGLGLPSGPARAGAESCMGQVATIVGSPGGSASGTAEADVIVSNGARSVRAGAGDDLICITGSTPGGKRVKTYADQGDDIVEVTSPSTVAAQLGEGEDTFIGGPEDDHVKAGYIDAEDGDHVDREPDTITTGDGDDSLSSGLDDGVLNPDIISLGNGDDNLFIAGWGGTADGGAGTNGMIVDTDSLGTAGPGVWELDNVRQQLAKEGEVRFTWTGFQRFELHWLAEGHPLRIIGSDQDEVFVGSSREASTRRLEIAAGGGDDVVAVGTRVTTQVLDGGPGRDTLAAVAGPSRDRLRLDLSHHRLGRVSHRVRSTVRRFEDVTVTGFQRAFVQGDERRNRIDLSLTCGAEIRGGGGPDRLRVLKGPAPNMSSCTAPRLEGGPGNDVLVGSGSADVLLGGPGYDVARGRGGRDRCVSEVRKGCELR